MAYIAVSRGLPPLGPLPGLLAPGAFLVGRTNRRAARALAARLAPAFEGWRSGAAFEPRVELALTLPPRLARRVERRETVLRFWLSLAIRWGAPGPALSRSAIAIRIEYAPSVGRWGEAMLNIEYAAEHE